MSLHSSVEPRAITLSPTPLYNGFKSMTYFAAPQPKLVFKIKAGTVSESLDQIKAAWKSAAKGMSFNYSFLDETIQRQYIREQHINRIVGFATTLVVLLASLGLFRLTSLMVAKLTKEIGVRKVLGSSVPGIIVLLSKQFLKWVAFANIIALPIAWYISYSWLQNYPYRTITGVWVFILTAAMTLIIALLTVSYKSIKAARSNPVDSLRYE